MTHCPLTCGCEYCVRLRLADGGASRFAGLAWLAAFAFGAVFWFALFRVFKGG